MKMKSKVLVVLLALVMVFSMTTMAGCGNDADATWGDRYAALLESGEARDNADYDSL